MTTPAKIKPKIHPSEYQLPLIGQRTRIQRYFQWIGVVLWNLVLLLIWCDKDWQGLHGYLPMFWIWSEMIVLNTFYIEPDLIITDKEIIVKFLFKEQHIPWNEVLKVEKHYIYTNVYVEKLTLFNRIWGLLSFSFHPCFRVSRAFSNHKEIAAFIRYMYEET